MLPGQRRAVADLDRPDDRGRLGERREVAPDALVRGDVGHDGPGADPQRAVDLADRVVELGDAA